MRRGCDALRPMVVALFAVLLLLLAAAPAFGAPAVWSAQNPAPGSTVSLLQPPVSVRVKADRPILTDSATFYIKVDGKYLRKPALVFDRKPDNTLDYTSATLSAPVHWALIQGQHSVDASVLDNGYVRHKTNWKFTVKTAPMISNPTPLPGSVVATRSPVITASVNGNAPLTFIVELDGQAVPSGFTGSTLTVLPPAPLEDEASHTVRVVVTDAFGVASEFSWGFDVLTQPKMQVQTDCAGCHQGYPPGPPRRRLYCLPWSG